MRRRKAGGGLNRLEEEIERPDRKWPSWEGYRIMGNRDLHLFCSIFYLIVFDNLHYDACYCMCFLSSIVLPILPTSHYKGSILFRG